MNILMGLRTIGMSQMHGVVDLVFLFVCYAFGPTVSDGCLWSTCEFFRMNSERSI